MNLPGRSRARADRLAEIGDEPDARFSLANERTFLAWIRTALGLTAAGLAVAEFLDSQTELARLVIALPLLVLGAVTALSAFGSWEGKERAMRLGEPLPSSSLPRILATAVGAIAIVAAALALIKP